MSDDTSDDSAMPWRVAAAALVGYGLFTGGLFMGQRHLMYHPGSDRPDLALAAVDGFQEVILTTADGLDLVSWYRPAEDGRQTIVVTHGNAGHIGHRAGKLAAFTDAGYGMLLIGYRGFGGNPGKPNEDGLYLDAEAGFAFLETQGVTPDQVIAYGESLGTAVAVEMAARYPLAAVILEAPFISIANVAASHYWYVPMAQLLVLDKFDAGKRIGDVSAPILMLHGARDSIVPTRMGQELFEVANQPKQFWLAPEADHGDLYDHGAAETALEFLDEHL